MNAFFLIFILVLVYGAYSRIIGVFILNIVGLPGVLIANKSIKKNEPNYIMGVIVAAIGQIYLHFAFMIYVISWVRLKNDYSGFVKYLIWFFCASVAVGTIQQIYYIAKRKENENLNNIKNPQIPALLLTEILSVFAFFLFFFIPDSIHPLWSWVLLIGYPI